MAKEYFKEHGIEHQEFDVSRDEKARNEMIKISGQIGVPVITVDENVIIGFDQRKLRALGLEQSQL